MIKKSQRRTLSSYPEVSVYYMANPAVGFAPEKSFIRMNPSQSAAARMSQGRDKPGSAPNQQDSRMAWSSLTIDPANPMNQNKSIDNTGGTTCGNGNPQGSIQHLGQGESNQSLAEEYSEIMRKHDNSQSRSSNADGGQRPIKTFNEHSENCIKFSGEERLRLINYQSNLISKIEGLDNLRNLVFLDFYNNNIEKITGLDHVPSLRVLMVVSITGAHHLRNLRRLVIGLNHIVAFEYMSDLLMSTSLIELSMESNPVCEDQYYRSILTNRIKTLKYLDGKRITEDERRVAARIAKREADRRRENDRANLLSEERRRAVAQIRARWETDLAKQSKTSFGRELYINALREAHNMNNRMAAAKSAPPIKRRQSVNADETNGSLSIYGDISAIMDKIDFQSVSGVSFNFIHLEKIATMLSRIKKIPQLDMLEFSDNNIQTLRQLNFLSLIRTSRRISISIVNNPVISSPLFFQYVLFRLSHVMIKSLNGIEVTTGMVEEAQTQFGKKAIFPLQQGNNIKASNITAPLKTFIARANAPFSACESLLASGAIGLSEESASPICDPPKTTRWFENASAPGRNRSLAEAFIDGQMKESVEQHMAMKAFDDIFPMLLRERIHECGDDEGQRRRYWLPVPTKVDVPKYMPDNRSKYPPKPTTTDSAEPIDHRRPWRTASNWQHNQQSAKRQTKHTAPLNSHASTSNLDYRRIHETSSQSGNRANEVTFRDLNWEDRCRLAELLKKYAIIEMKCEELGKTAEKMMAERNVMEGQLSSAQDAARLAMQEKLWFQSRLERYEENLFEEVRRRSRRPNSESLAEGLQLNQSEEVNMFDDSIQSIFDDQPSHADSGNFGNQISVDDNQGGTDPSNQNRSPNFPKQKDMDLSFATDALSDDIANLSKATDVSTEESLNAKVLSLLGKTRNGSAPAVSIPTASVHSPTMEFNTIKPQSPSAMAVKELETTPSQTPPTILIERATIPQLDMPVRPISPSPQNIPTNSFPRTQSSTVLKFDATVQTEEAHSKSVCNELCQTEDNPETNTATRGAWTKTLDPQVPERNPQQIRSIKPISKPAESISHVSMNAATFDFDEELHSILDAHITPGQPSVVPTGGKLPKTQTTGMQTSFQIEATSSMSKHHHIQSQIPLPERLRSPARSRTASNNNIAVNTETIPATKRISEGATNLKMGNNTGTHADIRVLPSHVKQVLENMRPKWNANMGQQAEAVKTRAPAESARPAIPPAIPIIAAATTVPAQQSTLPRTSGSEKSADILNEQMLLVPLSDDASSAEMEKLMPTDDSFLFMNDTSMQ
ncbi:Leucine-rich repeat-containing protein 49 [Blyttiomyces sp. JEL0837]|nr:Leucine-rich repeat-containing protein 49 [Blyttiomyces sp. JEL0837]